MMLWSPNKRLHGEEDRVWGDAGYVGIEKRAQLPESNPLAQAEKLKASVRAKVEYSFFYIKRVFGYSKVRYRGLSKNTNRLEMLAAFSNLLMARKYLPT